MAATEKELVNIFQRLPKVQKQALLDYADFLVERYGQEAEPVSEQPLDIPRPENESVVKAIKRLSRTYPMLDTKALFEKTSSFMTRSLMHGEDDLLIIDEMEVFFEERYRHYVRSKDEPTGK
jgi:hypothetical protein